MNDAAASAARAVDTASSRAGEARRGAQQASGGCCNGEQLQPGARALRIIVRQFNMLVVLRVTTASASTAAATPSSLNPGHDQIVSGEMGDFLTCTTVMVSLGSVRKQQLQA